METSVGKSRLILWIYAAGFFLGAATHAQAFLQSGYRPYPNAPLPINLYWTSLLILDLLVVFLIPFRPRPAVLLAVIVMTSDISVDLYAARAIWHTGILGNIRLLAILGFGGFVLMTAPYIWKQAVPHRGRN